MEYEVVIQNSSESTWTHEETMLLIQTYDKYKYVFDKGNRKNGWDIINTHLESEGVYKNSTQIAKKWANLLRTYRSIKCNNRKTGQSVIKFKYFEEMDQILGDKTIYSKAGVSVGLKNTMSKLVKVGENSEEQENIESTEGTSKMLPKKRSTNARQEYYKAKKHFFEEENERRREDHQSKIETRKEKLILLKQLVDAQNTKQN